MDADPYATAISSALHHRIHMIISAPPSMRHDFEKVRWSLVVVTAYGYEWRGWGVKDGGVTCIPEHV